MKNYIINLLALSSCGLLCGNTAFATNPLIMDQFTADPTARVFEGRVYVYPSHDMPEGRRARNGQGWFAMEDYHVFSSENLTDWTDHGIICNQTNVPWLNGRKNNDMWAPDCVFKNGTYYFYFPVGGRIGVATAPKPYGPWKVLDQPVLGAVGIDPCVLIDDDGTSYLFTGGISVGKLKENMVELEVMPGVTNAPPRRGMPGATNAPARRGFGGENRMQRIANLPQPGLIEGSFVIKRKGIYYLTYPHAVTNAGWQSERLEYSISTNAMGPYTWKGVITDQSESHCWTEHHSLVEYKGQWYLFYHDKDLSPDFDKNRSIRADKLYFNDDGTIQKVIPTLRGVGIVDARSKIQIDRYSAVSPEGTSISFLDDSNRFAGWKITLKGRNRWVQFNEVDFGNGGLKAANVRGLSSTGGMVEVHLDKLDGPVLAKVEIAKGGEWKTAQSKVAQAPTGLHNLVVTQTADSDVDLDWISFE